MWLRYLKNICLLSFVFLSLYITINQTYGMEGQEKFEQTSSSLRGAQKGSFKFKIGFEFQEISHLCEWAQDNINLQKKPILIVKDMKDEELWHLVIDTRDIEFVTPPFLSDSEEDQKNLELSINSITTAFEVLKELINIRKTKKSTRSKEKKLDGVSFKTWVNVLKEKYGIDSAPVKVDTLDLYKLVKNNVLVRSSESMRRNEWEPKVNPQVTIQHPLEYTIPLVVTLFGSKKAITPIVELCLPALPSLNLIKDRGLKHMDIREYFSKENGLLFLHAFACSSLNPSNINEPDINERKQLKAVRKDFDQFRQVDAKRDLPFLSRRPFSLMWKKTKEMMEEKGISSTFAHLYQERIIEGNNLFGKVLNNFKYTNYAAEYYDDHGQRKSLLSLLDEFHLFNKDVVKNEALQVLLQNGILSTSMIRAFNKEKVKVQSKHPLTPATLFDHYFLNVINSVDVASFHYKFNLETHTIDEVKSTVDSLSPPWFSREDDAMGAYGLSVDIDLNYGEAITEMRLIRRVFQEEVTDPRQQATFLTNQNGIFTTQGALLNQVNKLQYLISGRDILEETVEILEKNLTHKEE